MGFGTPFGAGTPGQQPYSMPTFAAPVTPSHTWTDAILAKANGFQDWLLAKAPWLGKALTATGGQKGRLASSNFHFEHLWFLWYLLLFVTIAPLIVIPLGWLLRRFTPRLDNLGRWLLRLNLGVLVLGFFALPAVLHAGSADWTLENPAGFLATFPDCLVQYFSDLPLYGVYFLAGWWLFRLRDELPSIAKYWLWNLVLGIAGFAISRSLFTNHGMQPDAAHYRLAAFTLYAVSAACSGMGLLGFFQRYLDRPTRAGKYFSDTILWIYLVQIAIIPHILPWIQSDRTAWWEASFAGMLMVTLIALAMFELFIRRTPLVHIFGPAILSRPSRRV
jgi:surface polysaccharide O-acyltransferase-like enzyme